MDPTKNDNHVKWYCAIDTSNFVRCSYSDTTELGRSRSRVHRLRHTSQPHDSLRLPRTSHFHTSKPAQSPAPATNLSASTRLTHRNLTIPCACHEHLTSIKTRKKSCAGHESFRVRTSNAHKVLRLSRNVTSVTHRNLTIPCACHENPTSTPQKTRSSMNLCLDARQAGVERQSFQPSGVVSNS